MLGGARELATSPYASIQFQNFDSNDGAADYIGAEILSHNAGSSDGGDLRFFTKDVALAEQMRIASSGNVGIGQTNPSAKLDVVGTTELNGDVTINSNLTVHTDTLFVNGSNGRVGIGTTSPATTLHVSGGDVLIDRGSVPVVTREITLGGARAGETSTYAQISFQNFDTDAGGGLDYVGARIQSHNVMSDGRGDLRFLTFDGVRLDARSDII